MSRVAVALVHHPCLDKAGQIYTTSITNLDVHDIARSGRTFGCNAFYIVTPVLAQQAMANEIIRFWDADKSRARNPDRSEALSRAQVTVSVEEAIAQETAVLGAPPLIVATSARPQGVIGYAELRARLPSLPGVLILFGTGHGLAGEVIDRADLVLAPIVGAEPGYNHLSVRSAAAIVLDRLLGQ